MRLEFLAMRRYVGRKILAPVPTPSIFCFTPPAVITPRKVVTFLVLKSTILSTLLPLSATINTVLYGKRTAEDTLLNLATPPTPFTSSAVDSVPAINSTAPPVPTSDILS
jgi:hypothetical protein